MQAQDAKVKGMSSELSRLEDRVRSESAQQAELQVSMAGLPGRHIQGCCHGSNLPVQQHDDNRWQWEGAHVSLPHGYCSTACMT